MKMIYKMRYLLGTMLLTLSVTGQAAVTHIVDTNGQLTGATGIAVNGSLFDVSFVASTFDDAYMSVIFDYHNDQPTALLFADALMAQVFVPASLGDFDTNPALSIGCASSTQCNTYIPYAASLSTISYAASFNHTSELNDLTGVSNISRSVDLGFQDPLQFAVFTPSIAAVPEPSTYAMLLAGVMMLAGVSRRRNRV